MSAAAQVPDSTALSAEMSAGFSPSEAGRENSRDNERLLPLGTDPQNRLGLIFVKHLVSDQEQFWTSPRTLRRSDVKFFAPFATLSGLVIVSDSSIARAGPDQPSSWRRSQKVSDYAALSLIGAGSGAYLWGQVTSNERLRETGLLSGEAALNSTAVVYALKSITQRPRPQQMRNGNFFQGGDSFPSEHSAIAWSVASVLAHEYPGPLTKFLAYGLASAVTLTRVSSQQHFASDALVGSALGWYFGRQVYRAHHDPERGGAAWGTIEESAEETSRKPQNMASPYVPLDSWIYPALDRLVALGVIDSVVAGIRPWTRLECARLVEEARERSSSEDDGADLARTDLPLYDSLRAEFLSEIEVLGGGRNLSLNVDSIYTRVTGISGPPLADGYHFGQSIINDYGRPYTEGLNLITGFESHASAGPFTLYVRGEYQHTPTIGPLSQSERNLIGALDLNPVLPAVPAHNINQFRLLDTYVAWTWENTQISAGKQSLWWGSGSNGPLLFSNDAEPVYMLRVNRVTPFTLPGWFRGLGSISTDFFFGKLSGHRFPNGPFIHGSKISFKPTPNLELGFSRTVVFAGQGHPLNFGTFWRSFIGGGDLAGRPDAGDRRVGFDFSYRIPKLRRWLTIYNDSMVDDDPLPLLAPQRAAMNPGLYLSHVPHVPKFDLRVEAVYTDVFTSSSVHGAYIYWNGVYHDSYTNQGNLLGNWIGREGRGYQAWSTYWFSPKRRLQIGYRAASVSKDFLSGGGELNDYRVRGETPLHHGLSLSGSLQYETWQVPSLVPGKQSNFAASFQIELRPHLKFR